jgi:translocation and assembly module TamB
MRNRRIVRFVVVALGALAMLVVLAAVALDSAAGKRFLMARLASMLATDGLTLETDDIGGSLWSRLTIGRLHLSDADGTLVEATMLELDWTPSRLLARELRVETLAAASLTVERLPSSGSTDETSDGALLPELPVDLTIDRIAVAELTLGPDVAGATSVVSLEAGATLATPQRVGLQLDVRSIDGGALTATVDLALDLDANLLDASADVDAPAGSALQNLIGLADAPALTISLDGTGPLDDWRGRLVVDGGPTLGTDLDLAVNGDGPWRLGAVGDATVTALVPADLQFAVAPSLSVDLDLTVDDSGTIDIAHATAEAPALSVSLAGTRAADGAFDLSVSAIAGGPEGWNEFATPARFRTLVLDGTLTGRESEPHLVATVAVEEPAIEQGRADAMTAMLDLAVTDAAVSFDVSGEFAGFAADPQFAAGAGDAPGFEFHGSYDIEAGAIALSRAHIALATLELDASGTIQPDPIAADLDLTASVADLAALAPLTGMNLVGRADLQAQLETDGDRVEARLTGTGEGLGFGDPTLDGLLGGTLGLSGDATIDRAGRLDIAQLALTGSGMTLNATGIVHLPEERIEVNYDLTLPRLAPLSPSLAGRLLARGSLTGPFADPGTRADATITGLRVDGTNIGSVRIIATLDRLATGARGPVEATGDSPAGRFRASFGLAQDATRIRFDRIDIAIADHSRVTGAAVLSTATGLVDGALDARIATFAPYGDMVGVPLEGGFEGRIELSPQGAEQRIALVGSAAEIAVDDMTAARMDVDLTATIGGAAPHLSGTIDGSDIVAGPATFETVALAAEGTDDGFEGDLQAIGAFEGPLSIDAGFAVAPGASGGLLIEIGRLDGTLFEEDLVLERPLQISSGPAGLDLSDFALTLGAARFEGAAHQDADTVAATLDVADLPVAWVGKFTDLGQEPVGIIGMQMTLAGTPAAPVLTMSADIDGLALRAPRFRDDSTMSGHIDAHYEAGRLELDSDWAGLGETAMELSLALPMNLALDPVMAEMPPEGALAGEADWRGDIRLLLAIVPIDPHRLAGNVLIDLTLGGTVVVPTIQGQLTMTGGEYENLETGTLLTGVNATVVANGGNDLSFDLTANDGGNGTVTAQGTLAVDSARSLPFDVTASFRQAVLIRRDDIRARATGEVHMQGTTESASLTGTVTLDHTDVRVDSSLPPSVTVLNVTEINVPPDRVASTRPVRSRDAFALALDLQIDIPNKAYVRGRGLDSEWQGSLHVTGTLDRPRVVGELTPRRGGFTFADRRFDISDSRIRFDGAIPVDPRLDISAASRASGLTAIVRVTGRASDPEITITSQPPLPQDEVMSRLLFGRRAGELSPVQALQLASALRALSGQGSGDGGIFDFARKTLGVDVLTVGGDSETGTTLEVGQYLTENVRVGVQQRFEGGGGAAATVEIELTDDVSVQTSVGSERSRVGITWGHDY